MTDLSARLCRMSPRVDALPLSSSTLSSPASHVPKAIRRVRWGVAAVLATALLAGCGGSDDNTAASGGQDSAGTTVTGVVVGSYFANARVCLDSNGNGRCDGGEPSTRTDDNGRFTLTGSAAGVVAEIGTDATELDPATGQRTAVSAPLVLRAPSQATGVVSLHSTSVVAAMQLQGLSFEAARAAVALAVDVPDASVLADFNRESDAAVRQRLQQASNDGLQRIAQALADAGSSADVVAVVNEAARADRYYQTKAPYRAPQDATAYEAPPSGFTPVYTEMVARHGSRGLSSLKYDLAVYNLWQQAQADGALTPLGQRLGDDVLAIMKANFLLGYGVAGISTPGYGNETQVGIREHQQLAVRLLQRLPAYWQQVAADGSRQIQVVSSGVDRAVDSANFFVGSLKTAQPALATRIVYPKAPAPYPDTGTAVAQPDGTDRFLLYFHKLDKKTDAVTNTNDARYVTYQDSLAYQAYKKKDADLLAKQANLMTGAQATAAGRAVLARLFTSAFIDKIASGTYTFANTGTMSFTSSDGQFSPTLSGDGATVIDSLGAAGSLLYELYVIAPAMRDEAGVDFAPYMPADDAQVFAELNDASDFYDKGPGMTEKGEATYKMAQILVDDLFNEVDAIARGDRSHAAKLRFAHAEIMIPLASRLGLKNVLQQVPLNQDYSYATNPWRGEYVSPMAANVQWDVYADASGRLIVKMLYNEKETDFQAACDGARVAGTRSFYDYAALKTCYGHRPA
ncbi:MAG: hypothetical protein GAK30_01306 [Paracidovorax wautersii]|uniref:Multiple inositol polyphosphate phosphatase 1 n=1 Tax=Paracidovorax wautersii TaxID=1177982 RepID=A0A7V8JQT0_9BURK|nr:MAG: hypothetical protein GAK30_01306 [Paracidovorax wautersii]